LNGIVNASTNGTLNNAVLELSEVSQIFGEKPNPSHA